MQQLQTIMMTDIIGFTRLSRQEREKIRAISQKHGRTIRDAVSAQGGRVINIFGDSALALFATPDQALRSAIEIQQECNEHPAIPMRIALHCGQIIREGEEVYGDAINLTSRILKVAREGNVLCSARLKDLLSTEEGVAMKSVGVFDLKYVEHPVEIFAVVHKELSLPELEQEDREIALQSASVAVMPFVDLGASEKDLFLGEGISEAVIHALSKLEGINVISRSSSFAFSRSGKRTREAGRLLGVAHVMEGSVQKHASKIRVTTQLINTRTGFQVFSETYYKELQDLFSIQEEIAWLIAWMTSRMPLPRSAPKTWRTRRSMVSDSASRNAR